MNRRLVKKWLVWLAPLLVLRSLLPVGFMLTADADGLSLAFCPTQSAPLVEALRQTSTHHAHAAHGMDHSQHHMPTGDGGSDRTFDIPCPFALAAAAAFAIAAPFTDPLPHLDDHPHPYLDASAPITDPVRADRIRGPPFFS